MYQGRIFAAAQATFAVVILLLPAVRLAHTQTNEPFKVLYSFGAPNDGIGPSSGVIFDKQGNAYGETLGGGNPSCAYGCGLVYELSPRKGGDWVETILYTFKGSPDGYEPNGGLAIDAAGNLNNAE